MKILDATCKDLNKINQIAHSTWYSTYSDILSSDQIEYMLDRNYNLDSLKNQINELKHHFLLVEDNGEYIAFAAYETNYLESSRTKVHKLYILPSYQGKGLGRKLIDTITDRAVQCNNTSLILNVNKYNKAVSFYRTIGFTSIKEEILDIGGGFVMDDFVMERTILK